MPISVVFKTFSLSLLTLLLVGCAVFTPHNEFALPKLQEYHYPNGLRLIVYEDRRLPVIQYQTWLGAGAASEFSDRRGVAHFVEHMMFRESKNYPDLFFDQYLSSLGFESNAKTSYDYTAYYLRIPSKMLVQVALIDFDRWAKLIFKNDTVEIERKVITQEYQFRDRSSAPLLWNEQLMSETALNASLVSPVTGTIHDISEIQLDDLNAFYTTFYRPELMTIVLVGDVDLEEAKRAFDHTFGLWSPEKNVHVEGAGKVLTYKKRGKKRSNEKLAKGIFYYSSAPLSDELSSVDSFLAYALSDLSELKSPMGISFQQLPFMNQGRFILTARRENRIPEKDFLTQVQNVFNEGCLRLNDEMIAKYLDSSYLFYLKSLQKYKALGEQLGMGSTLFSDPLAIFKREKKLETYPKSYFQKRCHVLRKSLLSWRGE